MECSNWAICFLAVFFVARLIGRRRPAPYPPGPKDLPFVGNVLDMPSTHTLYGVRSLNGVANMVRILLQSF